MRRGRPLSLVANAANRLVSPPRSRVCNNRHGLIRKYNLNICRQCFQLYAKDIGFIKVSSAHAKAARSTLRHATLVRAQLAMRLW